MGGLAILSYENPENTSVTHPHVPFTQMSNPVLSLPVVLAQRWNEMTGHFGFRPFIQDGGVE